MAYIVNAPIYREHFNTINIMRKTLLFITLIAGLLLASCDKDNPDSNNGQSDNTEKPSDDGEKPVEPIEIDLSKTSYWKGTVGNEEFFICVEILTEDGKEDLFNEWIEDSHLDDKFTNLISTVIRNTGNSALDVSYGLVSESEDGFDAEYLYEYKSLPRTFVATAEGLASSYNNIEFTLAEMSKTEFDDAIKTEATEPSYWESEKGPDGSYYSLSIEELSDDPSIYTMAPFSVDISKNAVDIELHLPNGGSSHGGVSYTIDNTIFMDFGYPEFTIFTIDGDEITGTYDGKTITMTRTEQPSENL